MMIINLLGLLLITLIIWWFWIYKPKVVLADKASVTVIVENGTYAPSRIQLPSGKEIILNFLRKDESPCAGTLMFSDFDISEELPLNISKEITLPPLAPGEYLFTCQMQMYRGELIIRDNH